MGTRPPTLHRVILVLCNYDEKGQGVAYRERNCTHWFPSVESYQHWIQMLSLPRSDKFYAYPLRNLSDQLAHLKIFKKDGFTGVVYDPQAPGADMTPIDDLISTIEDELRRV